MGRHSVTASIAPGAIIGGRYHVERAAGKGGMGSVYAVLDSSTGRRLALKHLQREAAIEEGPAAALFQREYHTLAHLRHPRVIEVFDYGVDGGRPFYTMELLDGSDLRELSPLPWRRACEVLRDVASSLALLHSRRLLHRDLSPRNVRCTSDGPAKLIDFGTMTPMGVARDVAGTPPYMAPEAVNVQALDARTDLFALGALAYWTLTGYDAYPARDARELRELWPRPVLPPSALVPGTPEAIDGLVMSLLSLDPRARPAHVAEVIDRLTAIAELEPLEEVDVARAYLTTPTLVGHAERLGSFHKRTVRACRGRGSAVLVVGRSGQGRSRLLQTFVLEAKLSGMLSLEGGSREAPPGPFGVLRAFAEELLESAPELAVSSFSVHAGLLGDLLPALAERLESSVIERESRPGQLEDGAFAKAFRDWLLDVALERPLVIAVDDIEGVDEASRSCLATLARDAPLHKLLVIASIEKGALEERELPMEPFTDEASIVELTPLSEEQTHRLLESVFGDVPNLQRVSGWVHALSQGNARTVMELAQYLVDHGVATYERGSWNLPRQLSEQSLPQSVEQALEHSIAELSPTARQLAAALSLVTEQGPLTLEEFVDLAAVQDVDQTYRAVEELVAAQILSTTGNAHRLRHRGLSRAVQKSLPEDEGRQLHLRLSGLYMARYERRPSDADAAMLVAHHRHRGGDMDGCINALETIASGPPRGFGRTPDAIETLRAAVAYGQRHQMAPARLFPLMKNLLKLAATVDPSLIEFAEPTIEQLRRDSGLIHYELIEDEPDPTSRVQRCLVRARQLYERSMSHERGLDPVRAVYELGDCALILTGAYAVRNDVERLRVLPSVFAPLRFSFSLFELLTELIHQVVEGLSGRDVSARRTRTLARLQHRIEGLDESSLPELRAVVTYWLGMDEAAVADRKALERAGALESHPAQLSLGAQIRTVYHLFHGNEADAETYRHRRELLALQSSITDATAVRGVLYEAFGYYYCDNLLGLKRVTGVMSELAERFPGWRGDLHTVRGLYELQRGEPQRALAELERGDAAAAHVQALLAVGRTAEALLLADESLRRYERERDSPIYLLPLQAARALALSESGESAAAAAALDADIDRARRSGVGGMLVSAMHEARARVAIQMEDRVAFQRHVDMIGNSYGRATAGLRARFERLNLVARRAMMSIPPQRTERHEAIAVPSMVTGTHLSTAIGRAERLKKVLKMVSESTPATHAYLFGMQASGLKLSATLGEGAPPDGLEDMLAFYLDAELDNGPAEPRSVTGTAQAASDMIAWINDGHRLYYPVLLSCIRDQRRIIAGVVALALPVQREPHVSMEVIYEVSHALLDCGDVAGADAAD
ncbi:MAG: protein kinase [Myxococcales bacterium]|nr:protein kinase [Myxococcales bacterium]